MAQEPDELGAGAASGDAAGALHVPFTPDRLLLRQRPADRAELVHRLCEALRRAPGVPDEVDLDALALDALTRDAEGGTVRVGPELVCLHLRRPDVSAVRVAIATLELPMVWTDGEPARVVCLLAAPRERPVQSLRVFAQLERLMADPAAVAWILAGRHAPDLAPWLDARLREEEGSLTARDLMRPSYQRVGPETPVPALTRIMARHNLDAIGISDEDRRLLGEVTADHLLSLGMPDFFQQLESVGFLAEFDPFERYFAREASLTARDVMRPPTAVLPPEATVLEVVFQLAVKRAPKVFVVEQGRLVGVIDRIRVIDRILEL